MNPDQIKQIVETIKTMNININDATTQKAADAIIPVVKMYLLQRYVDMFLTSLFFLGLVGVAFYWIKRSYDLQELPEKKKKPKKSTYYYL